MRNRGILLQIPGIWTMSMSVQMLSGCSRVNTWWGVQWCSCSRSPGSSSRSLSLAVFSFMWRPGPGAGADLSLQYRIVGTCHLVTLAQWPAASIDMSPFISRYMQPRLVTQTTDCTTRTSAFCYPPPSWAQHRVIPNLDPGYNSPHPAPIRPYTLHQDGQHRHPHPHPSFRNQVPGLSFHSAQRRPLLGPPPWSAWRAPPSPGWWLVAGQRWRVFITVSSMQPCSIYSTLCIVEGENI